jgi:hypothetical protein
MPGKIWTITKFKLKEYFGPMRSSKASLAIGFLAFGAIGLMGFLAAIGAIEYYGGLINLDELLNPLSAFFSAFLIMLLVLSLKGGITAFQADLDYLFTSSIEPREYLIGDLAFQFITIHILFSPFITFMAGLAWSQAIPWGKVSMGLLAYEAYVAIGIISMQALGVLNMTSPSKRVKALLAVMVTALIAPSVDFVTTFPIRYSDLPYPSSLVAKAIIRLLDQGNPLPSIQGVAVYLLVVSLVYYLVSERNIFYYAQPTVSISFGEMRLQAQAAKQRRFIERIGRYTTILTLDPTEGSLKGFLVRKELLRMVRDGSVFTLLVFFAMYAVIGLASTRFPTTPDGELGTSLLSLAIFYSALVPPILTINWGTSERENLWILFTSGGDPAEYFKALLTAFLILALSLPLGLMAIAMPFFGPPNPWLPLTALVMATMSTGVAMFYEVRFNKPRESTFSTVSFLGIILPILGATVLALPALALDYIAPDYPLQTQAILIAIVVAYTTLISLGLLRLIERGVMKMQF